MRLSARNQLEARIVSIERGPVHSKLKLILSGGETITSVISTEAVDDLKLTVGGVCYAVVKATSVMIAVDH